MSSPYSLLLFLLLYLALLLCCLLIPTESYSVLAIFLFLYYTGDFLLTGCVLLLWPILGPTSSNPTILCFPIEYRIGYRLVRSGDVSKGLNLDFLDRVRKALVMPLRSLRVGPCLAPKGSFWPYNRYI